MREKIGTGTVKQNNNSGFSLVELIIVVAILAIAAIPLMQSMGLASRTNARAQSIQNATSLGESVMEEIKSMSVEEIRTKYGPAPGLNKLTDHGTYYEIDLGEKTATQGETFAVKVKIDKGTYSVTPTGTPSKADKVGEANVLELPRIDDIDSLGQAVISSSKELNRYDVAAQNYFNEKKADFKPEDPSTKAVITSKTVDIVKKDAPGAYPGVTVTATVTYVDSASNSYTRDLYTGSFVAVKKNGSTEYKPLDSNIYIFYQKGNVPPVETINIADYSTYTNPETPPKPGAKNDSHRIYFVRQKSTDPSPTVLIERRTAAGALLTSYTFTFSKSADSLTDWYDESDTDIELITNVIGGSTKHIYREEARTRVYDITVELSKGGSVVTTLNSTVTASDATPTPTPP